VASDTLSVGTSPAITVQNQGFGLVFHASTDFLGVSCDGLFVRPRGRPGSVPYASRTCASSAEGLLSITFPKNSVHVWSNGCTMRAGGLHATPPGRTPHVVLHASEQR